MVPKLVEFRDALPKTDSGKASRRLAAEPANTTGSIA
jgi:long-chain acyl-CoA synthetase